MPPYLPTHVSRDAPSGIESSRDEDLTMFVIPGLSGKDTCDGVTRRELLRIGGSALLGLSLADLFKSEAHAKKKDEHGKGND